MGYVHEQENIAKKGGYSMEVSCSDGKKILCKVVLLISLIVDPCFSKWLNGYIY